MHCEDTPSTLLVLLADRGPAAAQTDLAAARAAVDAPWLLLDGDGDLGPRVSALADRGCTVLIVDPAGDPDLTAALTASALPAAGPGWLRADAASLGAPVVSAARSFAALQALVTVASRPRRRLTTGPRPLLSASLIVKDEQTALPTCLASLDGRVDELVVCDTGSSDRTVEIAEAFGARVVRTSWTHDFAAARNVPLAACQGAWVLSIDADERLVAPRAGDLRRALTPRGTPAYGILIRSLTDDAAEGAGFEHEAIRLFRRAGLVWVGAVHETVADARTGLPPHAVRFPGITIDHDGYLGTVYRERDKAARNLLLAEKDHEAALAGSLGRSVSKTAYELARALSLTAGTEARQEELLRQSLAQMPEGMGRLASSASLRLAGLLRRTQRFEEAAGFAEDAVRRSPSDPAAALELAEALRGLGRPEHSLDVLDTWGRQQLRDDEAVSRAAAVADVAIPVCRARCLLDLGRGAEAAEVLAVVAREHPGSFDQWPLLADLLRKHHASTWATELAALAPQDAFAMLSSLEVLPPEERRELLSALREHGIDPARFAADTGFRTALADALVDHDPEAVAQAALALEESAPHLALQAWLQLPPSGRRAVALARCHLALDDLEGAFAALDDLDLPSLDPPDLLTVALLAAHAGDADAAWAVLGALPHDLPPALAAQAEVLATALPARVELA